ncbi:MAG: ATP-dependent metallopeptidase FtsH/Yme1/Tma family protein, partial [Microthrixaceae bacterium]|nr:ATP-dependent metallopeptidase FtsH/Yme1/Tma family protein [Microthrixaceae bacterium]
MAEQTRPPQPPGQGQRPNSGGQPSGGFLGGKLPSWSMFLLLAVVIGSVLWFSSAEQPASELRYDELVSQINEDKVKSITWDNTTGNIEGVYAGEGEETFTSTGPAENPQDLEALLKENNVEYAFETPQQSGLLSLLSIILPFALILGFFAWMQRRASGQMSGVMSIGRSKAKTYSAERPGTTFADVAGYDGVKMEIKEVVDFLKEPDRFAAIGARIPKGVLLV